MTVAPITSAMRFSPLRPRGMLVSNWVHRASVLPMRQKNAGDIFTCFHVNHDKQPVKISLPVASSIRGVRNVG
jgi:hypothetical protein